MEEFVKSELDSYLHASVKEFDSSCVDDVVVNYVMAVLNDLSQDRLEQENEDCCTELIELLTAYIPEIIQIERSLLNDWILQLCDRYRLLVVDSTTKSSKPRKKKNLSSMVVTSVDANITQKDNNRHDGTDTELKDFVVSRYSFTEDIEGKEHHPVLKSKESKNMIRYRDNKVVSTKGDRYTVETKKDRENDEMKKTYINLKPLRKYRFH